MTKLSTMGASSCATIAIQGFKDSDVNLEIEYQTTGKYKKYKQGVNWFYNNVLYPTNQALGRTSHYPFSALMEEINRSSMRDKFIIAVLNEYQQHKSTFWTDLFEQHGFELVDVTHNNIGTDNYIYVRNLARTKESPLYKEQD